MPIVVQLKSTQRNADLNDIENIINVINRQHGFKIRGHEIQQLASIMNSLSITERAALVAGFCSKSEIEYLSYHTTIFENGENISDEKWSKIIKDSIVESIEEADMVRRQAGMKNDVVIVFHLTYYVPRRILPITKEQKLALLSKAKGAFIALFEKEGITKRKGIVMAVENSYPKYYPEHAIAGPYHPADIEALAKYGIRTVFDLSHYHLYASYVKYGSGNVLGDLDRQIHGKSPPSWSECIKILSDSLVQLHLSDARGFNSAGEGLALGRGEIPIVQVLDNVHSLKREIRGTIELNNGHFDHSRPQLEAAKWLLKNVSKELLQG